MMEFKRVFGWISDNHEETTEAVVYVSRCGLVKCGSYKLWNENNQSYSTRKERVYKPYFNRGKQIYDSEERKAKFGQGYAWVTIRNKTYGVHRLVAMAWIPNPESKEQVNHKNGVRDDNRVDNLEWVTNLENRNHAKAFDREILRGERIGTSKLTIDQVMEIKKKLKSPYKGQKAELAKKYGVGKSTITWIVNGGSWAHV